MNTENISTVEGVVVEDNPTVKKTVVKAKAIKKRTHAVKQAVADVAISPVRLINRAVYTVCYGVAYGAVYGALVIGNTFPEDSAVRKGLHEGLDNAVKDFDTKQEHVINTESIAANA